jgi:hypothetical protein
MQISEINNILNRHVFDDEEAYLITKITDNSDRFVGIFRSTTLHLKIIQNLLQSREVRFGDALEEVITKIIHDIGYTNLEKNLDAQDEKGKQLNCDQYFSTPDCSRFFLVEQKVRDDHDSTKKRGQLKNFERKIKILHQRHDNKLIAVMYFVDPSFTKNRKYYNDEFSKIKHARPNINLHLDYGEELFERLGNPGVWNTLSQALIQWRDTVPGKLNLNFDHEFIVSRTQSISLSTWSKFAENELLWTHGVVRCLFPTGDGLQAITLDIEQRFKNTSKGKQRKLLQTTVDLLKQRIKEHYNIDFPDNGQQRLL